MDRPHLLPMPVTLIGTLPNGAPVNMEFDAERCDGGMSLLEWLCAKSDRNPDIGWKRMNEWRREQKMEALP